MTHDLDFYFRVKILQWNSPVILNNDVFILGALHIKSLFLKMMGKRTEKLGLCNIWIESGVYGENTAENILKGKMWNRGFRAHKMTAEAL